MRCFECGADMIAEVERRYHYTESGLPNVWLENVEVRRCPQCGEEEVVLPHLDELHRLIAEELVRQRPRFTGAEVRFIRKTAGWSGRDLARRMRVSPETVSRWETGKEPVGAQSDLLLRYLYIHHEPVCDYPIESLADADTPEQPSDVPVTVKHDRGTWTAAPAA